MAELGIVCGTPKTVIAKLKIVLEQMQTGILALWANDGKVSEADSRPASA